MQDKTSNDDPFHFTLSTAGRPARLKMHRMTALRLSLFGLAWIGHHVQHIQQGRQTTLLSLIDQLSKNP
jgi:hypothetical protein